MYYITMSADAQNIYYQDTSTINNTVLRKFTHTLAHIALLFNINNTYTRTHIHTYTHILY